MNLRIRYLRDREEVSYSSFDGSFLFYNDIINYLRRSRAVTLLGHDVSNIRSAVRSACQEDIFLSIGPYAYLHYFWREVEAKTFRIVRDVSTWLWSGYWLQEELCAPLTRSGDIVIFPSHFARKFYLCHFPELNRCRCVVFYCSVLPRRKLGIPGNRQRKDIVYIGALSPAKGVDALVRSSRYLKNKQRVEAYGRPNSDAFERWVLTESMHSDFQWKGSISRQDLVGILSKAGCLVFPTVASRETLGRVILEALELSCPIVSTRFGPVPEILPADCLVPVELIPGHYCMAKVVPLAKIDEVELAKKLNDPYIEDIPVPPYYRCATLVSILKDQYVSQTPPYSPQTDMLDRIDVKRGVDLTIETHVCAFESFFGSKRFGRVGASAIDDCVIPWNKRSIHDYRLFPKMIDELETAKAFTILHTKP